MKRFLSLWFSNYKWARKFVGGRWLTLNEPGYEWVQWNDPDDPWPPLDCRGATFTMEDYT